MTTEIESNHAVSGSQTATMSVSSRKIYSSGKSRVLAVPPDWAKIMEDRYNSQVLINRYGEFLLVVPPMRFAKHRFDVKIENVETLRYELTSLYLLGVETVQFGLPSERGSLEPILKDLEDQLYGMSHVEAANEMLVTFRPSLESIDRLLSREFELYSEMEKQCLCEFEKFQDFASDAESAKRTIGESERNVVY